MKRSVLLLLCLAGILPVSGSESKTIFDWLDQVSTTQWFDSPSYGGNFTIQVRPNKKGTYIVKFHNTECTVVARGILSEDGEVMNVKSEERELFLSYLEKMPVNKLDRDPCE